eukprot:gene23397-30675_t
MTPRCGYGPRASTLSARWRPHSHLHPNHLDSHSILVCPFSSEQPTVEEALLLGDVMLEQKKIAVVGSGISGLSAAWLLHRNGAHVTLFEKDSVFGGHTLTDTSSPYPVDLGFQVYNLTTYPPLDSFFKSLGVDTEPSDMSYALSMDGGSCGG